MMLRDSCTKLNTRIIFLPSLNVNEFVIIDNKSCIYLIIMLRASSLLKSNARIVLPCYFQNTRLLNCVTKISLKKSWFMNITNLTKNAIVSLSLSSRLSRLSYFLYIINERLSTIRWTELLIHYRFFIKRECSILEK